jgi:hypothetical protein
LLVRLGTAEAMYALVKILGRRGDEAGQLAAAAGHEVGRALPATAAVRAGEAPDDVGGEDLLYAALALPPSDTDAARASDDIRTVIELVASDVDAGLQASGRTVGGLNDYEQLLRDDLHALVLAWHLARRQPLEGRAVDTVLRSGSTDDVARAIEIAASDVATTVAGRALERARRRQERFIPQAVGALWGLRKRGDVRGKLRTSILEALDDEDVEVRTAAIRAIAVDAEQLEPRIRRAVVEAFAALPRNNRAQVSGDLGAFGRDIVRLPDFTAVLAWAAGASPNDAGARASVAIEALDRDELALADAMELLAAVVPLVRSVESASTHDDRGPDVDRAVAQQVLAALARRPSDADALLGVPGVIDLVGRSIEVVDASLPDGARRALIRGLMLGGHTGWLAGDAADALPVLAALAAVAPDVPAEWDEIVRAAPESVQRRLLRARLHGLASVLRELEQLEQAQREQSALVLAQQRDAVLTALDEAETAARGNPGLLEQLAFVRQAVGAVVTPPDIHAEAPELAAWRARLDEDVGVRVVGERIEVATPGEGVVALMLEADRLAHSTETLSPEARAAARRDVTDLVEGLIAGGYGPDGPQWGTVSKHLRRRNELTRLLWTGWASGLDDAAAATVAVLVAPGGGQEAAMRLDALARRLDDKSVDRVAETIAAPDLQTASDAVGRLLRAAARARDALRDRVARSRHDAARRIAEELRLPLRAIESTLFGYFRLRATLNDLGWRQIAPSLGDLITRDQLEPQRQDLRGNLDADLFRVRSLGIEVDGEVVDRVIVEGTDKQSDEEVSE